MGCEGAIWRIELPGYLVGEVVNVLLGAFLTQLVGNRGALSYAIRLECGDGASWEAILDVGLHGLRQDCFS